MAATNLSKLKRFCQENGCKEKHWGRGYCLKHYNYARNNGLLNNGDCKELGCLAPAISKGLCAKHYNQINNNGRTYRNIYDPNMFEKKNGFYLIWILDKSGKLKGKAKIDIDDYDKVKDLKWCMGSHGYAENVKMRTLLHRLVIGTIQDGYEVDHINRDKLDNRKCNLRIASRSQNSANTDIRKSNTSGFKGVCWSQHANKYVAQVIKNGEHFFQGYFSSKIEAAKAYDEHVLKAFGEFSATNKKMGLL